jgi:hypothetical protein
MDVDHLLNRAIRAEIAKNIPKMCKSVDKNLSGVRLYTEPQGNSSCFYYTLYEIISLIDEIIQYDYLEQY